MVMMMMMVKMMMMMLVMLMQMMMIICVWYVIHRRACHMLPWERVSHGTHGNIKDPRSLGKGCEGARARATTARVGSSHPEQEGLGLETSTSEVRTRTGSATLCFVGLVEDVARRG